MHWKTAFILTTSLGLIASNAVAQSPRHPDAEKALERIVLKRDFGDDLKFHSREVVTMARNDRVPGLNGLMFMRWKGSDRRTQVMASVQWFEKKDDLLRFYAKSIKRPDYRIEEYDGVTLWKIGETGYSWADGEHFFVSLGGDPVPPPELVNAWLAMIRSKVAEVETEDEEKPASAERDDLEQLLKDAEKKRLTYSPDKKLLAHLDGRQVTVWSVEEGRRLHQFVLEGRPLAAAFSPDGGSLVTADGEGNLEYRSTIKLWSPATGEGRLIAQFLGVTTDFSFSPDGTRLAATSNLNFIGSITRNPEGGIAADRIQTGGNIYIWRVSDGRELLKVDIELPEYTAKLIHFQRAGADAADGNHADVVVEPLVAAYREAVRKRVPIRLNFSPDGQRLITVSKSGQETIFDSRTGKPLRPTARGEQDGADHPAAAPESNSGGKEKPDPESKGRSQ